MAGNLKYCLSLLQDNESSIKTEAEQVLLKLCNTIMRNPKDSRYRKIRLANAIVSTKLLPASGAIECLFEAGFIEQSDDGEILLPMNASLTGIKTLYNSLLNSTLQPACPQSSCTLMKNSQRSSSLSFQQRNHHSSSPPPPPLLPTRYKIQKNTFLLHLMAQFHNILRYEDKSLQDKVRAILPLEKLQISAMEKLREIQKEMKMKKTPATAADDVVFEDLLLNELLSWFKFKFFKWVNMLVCHNCMGECYNDGSRVSPDPRISRIEIHKCKSCKYENHFPRYTDPEPLLYTRRGRCGEWANCFTLICRSVGFDARLIYDETDHMWTEVWSVAHSRWIHADACENLMDQPLVYEKGWTKRLSYVIAFSRDDIQDVTWRYTRNYEEVMRRRKHCSEEALALFICQLNQERQTSVDYSSVRRKFVLKRCAFELAEMMNAPPGYHKKPTRDHVDYEGRTSGSLAWRISRGEVVVLQSSKWYVPEGISNFQLLYDIVKDAYTTIDTVQNKTLEMRQKWQTGVERVKGAIYRKEEPDWKMVYLARSPADGGGSAESSKITWTLAVNNNSIAETRCINSVKLQARATTFNSATVKWQVEGLLLLEEERERKILLQVADCQNFETTALRGAIEISVSATLSGGEGNVAWQHAQLFRQSLNDDVDDKAALKREPSLLIQIDLVNSRS